MSTGDLIALFAFILVILLGLIAAALRDLYESRPKQRIKARLYTLTSRGRTNLDRQILAELRPAQTEARRRRLRQSIGQLGYYMNRLDTVAGAQAWRFFIGGAILLALLGLLILVFSNLPANLLTFLLLVLGLPLLVAWGSYRYLVQRFNQRFIQQLPDAMDAIVRASQAGVPVTQSIREVGIRISAPLGPEFKRMGDALLLGHDLEDVLDEASLRIELSDFSFFTVCVMLQRETGGSIVEALENLSAIIRARRDLNLKARALTAEGRLSGLVIALIPFIIIGMLYLINREYIMVLFTTETGRSLLWSAGIMLTIGLLIIRRLTNLKV